MIILKNMVVLSKLIPHCPTHTWLNSCWRNECKNHRELELTIQNPGDLGEMKALGLLLASSLREGLPSFSQYLYLPQNTFLKTVSD